jgi:hypothetical protein
MLFCVILRIEGKGQPITCRNQSRWLRPLAYWDWGFESCQWHRCLFLVNVVCCELEVTSTGQSLVQRIPTENVVSEFDLETSTVRKRGPTRAIERWGGITSRYIQEVDVLLYPYTTSALDGGRWSAAHSGRFTSEKEPR